MAHRDDVIGYLLHRLPDADREAIAARCLEDPALHDDVRSAEAELLDAYARGEASPADAAAIETWLLASTVQRRKLAFARALTAALPSRPVPRHMPWLALGAAAAVIVAVASAGWFWRLNVRLRDELAAAQRPALASAVPASVVAVALRQDDVRGASRDVVVTVPAGVEIVRFELEIDAGDAALAMSATASASGRVLWTEEPVRGEPRGAAFVVPVWIPGRLLPPGRYELRLTASGKALAYYAFTMRER